MNKREVKDRRGYFKKFGQILVKRYGQNYAARQHGPLSEDAEAVRLGRYLRAARSNAGLSPQELARQAQLPLATLLALENGLIVSSEIQAKWLSRLARALKENLADFNLLLKRSPAPSRQIWPAMLVGDWLRQPRRPVLAAVSAVVLCLVISAISLLGATANNTPPIEPELVTFIDISAENRLNLIKAEKNLKILITVEPAKRWGGPQCCIY